MSHRMLLPWHWQHDNGYCSIHTLHVPGSIIPCGRACPAGGAGCAHLAQGDAAAQ